MDQNSGTPTPGDPQPQNPQGQPAQPQTPGADPHYSPNANFQQAQDAEHLRILSILFYIYAGLQVLGACCAGAYFSLIGAGLTAAAANDRNGPGPLIGIPFIFIFGLILIVVAAVAFLHYKAGKGLADRRDRIWIMVAAGLACLNMPLGTLLGVFTFITLSRPSVRALFPD